MASSSGAEGAAMEKTFDQIGDMNLLLSLPKANLTRVYTREEMLEELAEGQLDVASVKLMNGQIALIARIGAVDFPLGSDTSALRSAPLQYVFTVPGSIVYGVTLAEDVDKEGVQLLETLLAQCCQFAVQEDAGPSTSMPAPEPVVVRPIGAPDSPPASAQVVSGGDLSASGKKLLPGERLASFLDWSSKWTERQLIAKGDAAAASIANGESYWKSRTQRYQQPTKVHWTLHGASRAASSTAGAVNWTAGKVMGAVGWGVTTAASGIVGTASMLGIKGPENPVLGIRSAALASVDAIERVFDAMEVSGKKVLATSATTASDYTDHRYGPDAASLVEESLSGMGKLVAAGWTLRKLSHIGATAVGKKILTRTAVYAVKDKDGKLVGATDQQPGTEVISAEGQPLGVATSQAVLVSESTPLAQPLKKTV